VTEQDQTSAIPEPARKQQTRGISVIWLVPLVALLISLWLAWHHYASLGELITIRFESADGLEAGKTPVRFRNVEVGKVEKIQLDDTLTGVIVSVRMTSDTDRYLNDKTRFWVERPRIGLAGISGLGTLFSGAYIAMSTTTHEDGRIVTSFTGLDEPPLTPEAVPGIRLVLTSKTGSAVSAGTPIYHKQVQVGQVESRELSSDGQVISFGIFIEAPYDTLVNSQTKFWQMGSFSVDFGPAGISLDMEPLAVLLSGGIAFDTPKHLSKSSPVMPGSSFNLYDSRDEANFNTSASENALGFVLHFDESLRGLTIGSPVEFHGVEVGYVADISISREHKDRRLSVPVLIFIEPERFGTGNDREALQQLLQSSVRRGLRARLQTASLVTGQLFIELIIDRAAGPAIIIANEPWPEFPTIPSPFGQIIDNISAVLQKLERLEIEELVTSANLLLRDVDALVRIPDDSELGSDPEARRAALAEAPVTQMVMRVNQALEALNPILESDGARNLPDDLGRSMRQLNNSLVLVKRLLEGDSARSPLYYEISTTLEELKRAAQSIRTLTETLDEKPNALIFGTE
jgi:paraquat-inducible protein B